MSKFLLKAAALITCLALIALVLPAQPAWAAGEPTPPSDLTAQVSVPGDLAISLSWADNSSDETTWEIERCTGTGCTDFTLLAVRDAAIWGPWLNDLGLAETTTYSYRVRAVNANGASIYTNAASATTGYARPNGILTILSGAYLNNVVEITWREASTNETRFDIERYEVGSGETAFTVIASVPFDSTSYIDTTALRGASYLYRVSQWRYDVYGGASDTVSVDTGVGIAAPTMVKAAASSSSSIRLSWKGRFDAGALVAVQRESCDLYGCNWLTVGQVDASLGRFVDTGLAPNTAYTYRIRAVTSTSVSPWTNSVTATTRR